MLVLRSCCVQPGVATRPERTRSSAQCACATKPHIWTVQVKFAGESADDYGGPYREVFTVLCSELQDDQVLPLLLQTPNGQHNLGSNRDKCGPLQPQTTCPLHRARFPRVRSAQRVLLTRPALLCSAPSASSGL